MRISQFLGRLSLIVTTIFLATPIAQADPVQFEGAHTHPLAIDNQNDRLFVVNTPDSRVSIFDISGPTPVLQTEVRVALEPVTVKLGPDGNLWVVSEVGDAINIVHPTFGSVIASLNVGDEPADIVFVDDPTTPGEFWVVASVSQDDRVVICEVDAPYSLVASIDLPGNDPRALAVTPDGSSVWVAAFESGNKTTMIPRFIVKDPASPYAGAYPPYDPPLNPTLPPQFLPDNGMMARYENGAWLDDLGGDWTALVPWTHTDIDLIRIGIDATPEIEQEITGVGTLLEDIAIDPDTGEILVINVEQHNEVRFEPNLKGEFADNRLTIVDPSGTMQHYTLNDHLTGVVTPKIEQIDISFALRQESLAFPTEVLLATVDNQKRAFVTSIGSKRIAKINPNTGNIVDRFNVPEGGTGLGYHERTNTLYMLNRFANTIVQVNASSGTQGATVPVGKSGWDPTPAQVKAGRRFLYTGSHSATGGLSCAHCHPSGNLDNQAWDLGDPSSAEIPWIPPEENGDILINPFHPVKGPMTTQTLRGMKDTGRLHWRGDREDFLAFNGAFSSLLGGTNLSDSEMQDYEAFILSLVYPPNPFLSLDDQLPTVHPLNGANAQAGEVTFMTNNNEFCVTCHAMPAGTQGLIFPIENLVGFGEQPIKIPQLRNMYEKTGFDDVNGPNRHVYGYLHDGMDNNLDTFAADPVIALDPALRDDLVAFLLSFRTGTHPATGAEVTISGTNAGDPAALQRRDLIVAAAAAGVVDVIAHGWTGGEERGFVYANGAFQSDRTNEIWTMQQLMDEIDAIGTCFTFAGVPLGEGIRMGVDRDLDGFLDGTEKDMGTDPADPNNAPTAVEDPQADPRLNQITSVFPAPFTQRTTVEFYLSSPAVVTVNVFDVRGRRVRTLLNQKMGEGRHSMIWDGRDRRGGNVAAGAYFVKMETPHSVNTRKITRIQ